MIGTRSWSTRRRVCSTNTTTHEFRPGNASTAGSGARSGTCDPTACDQTTWTSADAAGLPILPGLVNYDEVKSGHIDHAIRFTAADDQHQLPVAGAPRGRLERATPTTRRWERDSALRRHSALPGSRCVARMSGRDHSNEDLRADPRRQRQQLVLPRHRRTDAGPMRWSTSSKQIPASAFQAINESCLMIHPNSGQARQPGTAAYERACALHQ